MTERPVLYSFRRCPYAMRARMALRISQTPCELREVKLADKPQELVEASPKGTVPVLVMPNGAVIDESIDIMRLALGQSDPEGWLAGDDRVLLDRVDGAFKHHLDRYKYHVRYDADPVVHRSAAMEILRDLDDRLACTANLCGERRTLTDIATFPFVRQFANHDPSWFEVQELPHLQGWLHRHIASELFAAIMAKYAVWQPADEPVMFAP